MLADPLTALGGLYTAPFGFVLRPLVNQRLRCVPLVLDRPADLAAVNRAIELVAAEGGFDAGIRCVARVDARIRLSGLRAAADVMTRLRERTEELRLIATRAIPRCASGEVPLALELLPPTSGDLQLRLQLEAPESAPLASGLHDAARALAPVLHRIADVRPSVRVDSRSIERVSVSCRIPRARLLATALSLPGVAGHPCAELAVDRATAALARGSYDPSIAAAHNAMVEHGIAAVALAFGNASGRIMRALEQHAARWGGCAPLCSWRMHDDAIEGTLELPLELSTHGRWRVDATTAGADGDTGVIAARPGRGPSSGPPGASRKAAGARQAASPHPPGRARAGADGPELDPSRDAALLAACIGMAGSLIALEDAVRARALERRASAPPPRRRRAAPLPARPTLPG